MVMAVTSQAVNQIEIMRSPAKLLLQREIITLVSRISGMTAATRGQQIDKNCTQISKGAEM